MAWIIEGTVDLLPTTDWGDGDDFSILNVSRGGASEGDLGAGDDVVRIDTDRPGQVRVTFTSAEVGNGNPFDSNTLPNQDGALAVRIQRENGSDKLVGPVNRLDDEGITFVSGRNGPTFDVRDLVTGTQRGDKFEVVRLGTEQADSLGALQANRPYYINAGMGDDLVAGGKKNDFLVGGAGNDTLIGYAGDDSLLGGGGNDMLDGGRGNDTAIFNVSRDGSDQVDLGVGRDLVQVSADAPGQVRLTFTSAEVGNASARDSLTMPNQDGGLAVYFQAEDGTGALTGPASRFDDEGTTFDAVTAGVTFDVRDLVSGAARGDQFQVVTLGTEVGETINVATSARAYYVNAGMGDDHLVGGSANDFLVGGAGNDMLGGRDGNDSLLGGGGDDKLNGGAGDDAAIVNVSRDGADMVNLGAGSDVVRVTADVAGQIRLTFTSAEVGNALANSSGTLPNQDGGLALYFQAEDGADALTGPASRYDDEGITFDSGTAGVTFDVRDLVSGAQRGDQFAVVQLGTEAGDVIDQVLSPRAYYVNAGMGNDNVRGGMAADFLVGGAGEDTLSGHTGGDSLLGGAGTDAFVFNTVLGGTNVDTIIDFATVDDWIMLDNDVFAGLTNGPLAAGAFALATATGEADDRIIYDQTTGGLFFDVDGGSRGNLTAFATLANKPIDLSASDFIIV